ncbi:MAG: glycosyltransferase family 39 protein, partial [Candidatus Shapirobacteria bacterium]|nr:glycosyltransferase family 39 protein [Candidatus Shapirobacteria bacterium]
MKFKNHNHQQKLNLKLKTPGLAWKKFLLWGIIILAAVLRLYNLQNYPAGLNADEAAIGYNAYSLTQTGRDEHEIPWPIHFKSFGDYKPGFYFYLVLPFVKFLGLNIWSVRLPAAFLGILSVLVLMLLVKEIFEEKHLANRYSLLSGFFLAISPWHLHFGRGGWESGAAIFFILLGVWLFLKAVNHRFYFILFSVLSFVISLYTYHSARLVSPLLFLGLVILFRRKIFARINLKWIIITALVGLMALIP